VSNGNSEVNLETGVSMVLSLVGIGVGSVVLAAAICYASAYALHHSDAALREHPTYEISIILLSAYASYVAADLCSLSGLLAVFFSGVFIRHYHMYNISPVSASAFTHLLSTISFLAENFIYLYLGISVIAYTGSFVWDWGFAFGSLAVLFVARALNTFPLCATANLWRAKENRVPFKHQVVIWFSGLRGAIAFALALNVQSANAEHVSIIKSSTLFTVIFTTVFLGAATGPLLRGLGLSDAEDDVVDHHTLQSYASLEKSQSDQPHSQLEPPLSITLVGEKAPLISHSQSHTHSGVHQSWIDLDETYLKPLFGGNPRRPRSLSTDSM
jgi:solute carrier family 9 (sodium/hydrogen exchanger), member 8